MGTKQKVGICRTGVFVCYFVIAGGITEGSEDLDAVLNAWEHRMNSTKTAVFHWQGTSQQPEFQKRVEGKMSTSGESTFECTTQLMFEGFDGKRVFHETNAPVRNGETGYMEQRFIKTSVIGDVETDLFKFDRAESYEARKIQANAQNALFSLATKPLTLTYRVLEPRMGGYQRSKFRMTPRRAEIGGAQCVVVAIGTETAPQYSEFWVDPTKDYSVVRYRKMASGKLRHQIDMEYREDPTGWIPKRWKMITVDNDGSLRSSLEDELTNLSLNASLPDSDFDIEIPEGTLLTDYRTGREWFMVGADGNERMISKDEASATYVQNMQETFPKHTRQLAGRTTTPVLTWILGGAVVFVILLSSVAMWKRH